VDATAGRSADYPVHPCWTARKFGLTADFCAIFEIHEDAKIHILYQIITGI
jgi:hypothetical protein